MEIEFSILHHLQGNKIVNNIRGWFWELRWVVRVWIPTLWLLGTIANGEKIVGFPRSTILYCFWLVSLTHQLLQRLTLNFYSWLSPDFCFIRSLWFSVSDFVFIDMLTLLKFSANSRTCAQKLTTGINHLTRSLTC